jgi:hypothetical protein
VDIIVVNDATIALHFNRGVESLRQRSEIVMTLEGGVRWLVAVFVADSEMYSLGCTK